MEIQLQVGSSFTSLLELKHYLETQEGWNSPEGQLEFRSIRSTDPAILVAIVGTVGTGLGSLITGLLNVAGQSSAKKIVLESANGTRLEFPADLSPEQIDMLIDKVKTLDPPKIIIP